MGLPCRDVRSRRNLGKEATMGATRIIRAVSGGVLGVAAVPALWGCATYSKMLVNPNLTVQRCAQTGVGLIPMAAASNAVDTCVANLRAAGYYELDEAGVTGILHLTDDTSEVRILAVKENSPA